MKVLNAALSALVASTLIAAPVVAQAAPAAEARTAAAVKGDNLAGFGWGWIFAALIVIGVIAIIAADSNEKIPTSP